MKLHHLLAMYSLSQHNTTILQVPHKEYFKVLFISKQPLTPQTVERMQRPERVQDTFGQRERNRLNFCARFLDRSSHLIKYTGEGASRDFNWYFSVPNSH